MFQHRSAKNQPVEAELNDPTQYFASPPTSLHPTLKKKKNLDFLQAIFFFIFIEKPDICKKIFFLPEKNDFHIHKKKKKVTK